MEIPNYTRLTSQADTKLDAPLSILRPGFGVVKIFVTSDTTVSVPLEGLIVNGVKIRGEINKKFAYGAWQPDGIRIRRSDTFDNKPVSDAAQNKVMREVQAAIDTLSKNVLIRGKQWAWRADLCIIENKIDDTLKELDKLLAQRQEKIAAMPGYGGTIKG